MIRHAPTPPAIAIVVHVFYLDVFSDMLDVLDRLDSNETIFITAEPRLEAAIRGEIERRNLACTLRLFPNRGRDVLPFLLLLKDAELAGYPLVLKLHTKRTVHRADGEIWREDMLRCLATPPQRRWIAAGLSTDDDVGLVGAKNHVISVARYMGGNHFAVLGLAKRMGIETIRDGDSFTAGTMFMAKQEALRALSALDLSAEAFDVEEGQIDGTMAHAVERAFGYSVRAAGLHVAGVAADAAAKALPFSKTLNHDYGFAVPAPHPSRRFGSWLSKLFG